MSGPACVVFDDTMTDYDFGPGHPMSPLRVDLTMRLARELGVVGAAALPEVGVGLASDDLLSCVHDPAYIAAVRAITGPGDVDYAHGIGTDDNPAFAGMHEASAHVVGATVEAARLVWEGEALHAANIAGGLHHGMRDRASGFCIYNDLAVGINRLLAAGAERVAYVDVDVHHGDGVQEIFYDDPRVLTISLHETPQTLFPGTGRPTEVGGPGAEGSAVNVALPPGTADAGWLRAFFAVVPHALRAFEPQVLVTQHGCDSHMEDPLAHLMLSVDGQRASYLALHDLAHELCEGRWVVTGGGGYAIADVVPRAWSHLLAVVGGAPLDPEREVPQAWRAEVERITGHRPPTRLGDGRSATFRDFDSGYDPDSWLDSSIMATREAVFPSLGLDPHH
jgi:acetoin utilization protein AcuC